MNPTELIDNQIADLGDWRGETLARLRQLIHAAAPEITEEWNGLREVYTQKRAGLCSQCIQGSCQAEFFKGAALKDPKGSSTPGWIKGYPLD